MFDRSVNKVVLIGNLGKDPEMRFMQSGSAVASLTLATTLSWKDKQSDERRESTEWHRLSVFNRLGELCGQYLKKGNKIYIEGRLKTNKWQGNDGSDRYSTEIVVSEIEMLDSKSNNSDFSTTGANRPDRSSRSTSQPTFPEENSRGVAYGEKPPSSNSTDQAGVGYTPIDFDEDDIPF